MNKITLVCGGAGFLGSHLCKKLVEWGKEVVCIDNLSTGSFNNIEALLSLKPNTQWKWEGTDYSGLTWTDTGTAPTEIEINNEITRLTNAEGMRLLRLERDRLLAATDWRASSDLTLADAWKTYRQSLRDLPASATPKLKSDGTLDESSFTWPTKP